MAARKSKGIELTPKAAIEAKIPVSAAPEPEPFVPDRDAIDFTADEAPRTFYRCKGAPGLLFYQNNGRWFQLDAYAMDGQGNSDPCDPFDEGLESKLEAFGDQSDKVSRLYSPIRQKVVEDFAAALETLPLQEMEALIRWILMSRNIRTHERTGLIKVLGLDRKRIPFRYVEPWFYQRPDGSPLEAEQKEQAVLERAAVRENPARGRDLRDRQEDADGLVSCPVDQGSFWEPPLWEAHARGRNWAAKIRSADRTFLSSIRSSGTDYTGPVYLLSAATRKSSYSLAEGDLIEFAADYFSELDEKVPTRRFCLVHSLSDKAVVFRVLPNVTTIVEAEKAAKALNEEKRK